MDSEFNQKNATTYDYITMAAKSHAKWRSLQQLYKHLLDDPYTTVHVNGEAVLAMVTKAGISAKRDRDYWIEKALGGNRGDSLEWMDSLPK